MTPARVRRRSTGTRLAAAGAWALFACASSGCSQEVRRLDATQITARIYIEPTLEATMASLRVRSFSRLHEEWVAGQAQTFPVAELFDPADVAFVPRHGTANDRPLEIIVEALDDTGRVLVQQRAITSFVARQQRVLELWLAPCGRPDSEALCSSDPACHGTSCLTCVGGACAPTPVYSDGDGLLPLSPTAAIDPSRRPPLDAAAARLDAGDPRPDSQIATELDGGALEAARPAASAPDAQPRPGADAKQDCGPDQQLVQGVCTAQDDCVGVTSCAPGSCVDGVRSYACSCPTGFVASGPSCVPVAADCAALACQERCSESAAGPLCGCRRGQVLTRDGKTCHDGAWSELAVLSETGSVSALAVSPTGGAMALWLEASAARQEVWSRPFTANAWQERALVGSNGDSIVRAPDVTIDALDRSTAIWVHFGDRSGVSASRHVGGAWQPAQVIDVPVAGASPSELKVVSSPAGVAFAIWRRGVAPEQRVYANRMDERGQWAAAQALGGGRVGEYEALYSDIAVDHEGVATAVWTQRSLSASEPPVAVLSSYQDGLWTMATGIDSSLNNRSSEAHVAASSGASHVLWSTTNGVFRRIVSPTSSPAVEPVLLASDQRTPAVGAGDRAVAAAWAERPASNWLLWAAHDDGSGRWSELGLLDQSDASASSLGEVKVAVSASGSSAVLWSATKGGSTKLYVSRYLASEGRWSNAAAISGPSAPLAGAELGIDEGDRVLAVWTEQTPGGGTRVVARRFE